MKRIRAIGIVLVLMIVLAACAPLQKTSENVPIPPSASGEETEDLKEDASSVIESLAEQMGSAPDNVVGFCAGYKKNAPINSTENHALLNFIQDREGIFAYYNMDCVPTTTADGMSTYDEGSENGLKTGYSGDQHSWSARVGYNKYTALGNLDEVIGKTVIDLVSVDKSIKKASTSEAQATIDQTSIYAYWIISLPEDNHLKGVVYNTGTDDRREPVKKGTLRFKRVGPGPSKVDVKVTINEEGRYTSDGELTAGHYEVSFIDGKKEKIINENWLYVPSIDKEKDWLVLVNNLYHITYDSSTFYGEVKYDVHMEWEEIPIDWNVTSEEAYQYGMNSGFMGNYCLTYAYFDEPDAIQFTGPKEGSDDEETEIIPGYLPIVFRETEITENGLTFHINEVPTLSFYRGAPDTEYIEDAYYVCMIYETVVEGGEGYSMGIPNFPAGALYPQWEETEIELQAMFEELASKGRLDAARADDLIDNGEPLELGYTWTDGTFIKLRIEVQE